jgi:iron complex outermembrane recepter protein
MNEPRPSTPRYLRSFRTWTRLLFFLCTAQLALGTTAAAGDAPLKTVYAFDVPQMPRIKALVTLSRQANGLHLDYAAGTSEESSVAVGPIQGTRTLEEALSIALDQSTLGYRWEPPNSLVIEPRTPVMPAKQPIASPATSASRVSQVETDGGTPREEIVVSSVPLPGNTDATAAIVIERRELDSLGATTASEALNSISQNAFLFPEGQYASGAQYAQIRGLGPDTMLILIDGRRTWPSATGQASNAFDLNALPLAAVERIEIIPAADGVAFGTDATGGIINFVLRRKLTEPIVELRYGGAAGGARQRRGTLHVGTDGIRFKGIASIHYVDQAGLLGAKRKRWSTRANTHLEDGDLQLLLSPIGNIASVDGRNLPGLNAPIAAVPPVDLSPGTSAEDFAATAGFPHQESLLPHYSIVPESARKSLVASGTYILNGSLTLSTELLYAERRSDFYLPPPALLGMPVPATNAYSPFDVTVLSLRLIPELGPQSQSVSSTLTRAATALHLRRGAWSGGLSALHSREQAVTTMRNTLDLTPEGAVMKALASADPTEALNPFQAGPLGTPEQLRHLLTAHPSDRLRTGGLQLLAQAEGPVTQTRAGPVTLMLGTEWRQEAALLDRHAMGGFDEDRDIRSAYLRVRAPLVDSDTALPGVHQLLVSAASRVDQYEGMRRIFRSHYGVAWHPIDPLTVRLFQGRSFRPPSLYELNLPRTMTPVAVHDPARNDEPRLIDATVGGNSTLKPQTAATLTAGVTAELNAPVRWTLAVDYWRIRMKDRVSVLAPQTLLTHESQFPDRTTRVNAELAAVDASYINTAQLDASGIDLALRAELPTPAGQFTPSLRTTWFNSFRSIEAPGATAVERINLASESGSVLRWRANLSLDWSKGRHRITTTAHYSPSYDDAVAGVRTGRELSSKTLIDLQWVVDLGGAFGTSDVLDGFSLAAGAHNLFNVEPDVADVGRAVGFDPSQGDLMARTLYIGVAKRL